MKQSRDRDTISEQKRDPRAAGDALDIAPERERPGVTARAPLADTSAAPVADPVGYDSTTRGDPLAEAAQLARNGDLQEAASAYRNYLTRHPEEVSARRGLAGVLEQKGDFVGALGEIGRAIDPQPDDVSLLCGRAAVQMALQRYDQAEADLRRASKLDADSAEVLFNFGMLF